MPNIKKGFTLVELSIVLVIIGLLIGGILVAQSMISTAKITSQIRQIQQLDIAVQNFITKTKYIPGDCLTCQHPDVPSICSYPNCQGNGDGYVARDSSDPGSSCIGGISRGECMSFFYDLATLEGFTDKYDPTVAAYGSGPSLWGNGGAAPVTVLNKAGGILFSQNQAGDLYWFVGAGGSGLLTAGQPREVTPAQALAIDTKLDDGDANTGSIVLAETDHGTIVAPYPLILTGFTYQSYLATDPDKPSLLMQIKANISR